MVQNIPVAAATMHIININQQMSPSFQSLGYYVLKMQYMTDPQPCLHDVLWIMNIQLVVSPLMIQTMTYSIDQQPLVCYQKTDFLFYDLSFVSWCGVRCALKSIFLLTTNP